MDGTKTVTLKCHGGAFDGIEFEVTCSAPQQLTFTYDHAFLKGTADHKVFHIYGHVATGPDGMEHYTFDRWTTGTKSPIK